MPLSDEIQVMFAPRVAYRRLAADPPRVGVPALFWRPALVALVIGGFVTLANTGELYPTLFAGSALAWSWVPLLQMTLAAPLIALFRRRSVPLSSALDLFFVGHGPWSLWLLAFTLLMMSRLPAGMGSLGWLKPMLLSSLVAVAWTWVLLFSFARAVLGASRWAAALFTLLYQSVLWQCAHFYVGAATYRLWPFAMYGGWAG